MREISIGGVLVSPLLPCFLLTVPLFWAVDKVLRRAGCYRFVWHANLVRVALFIMTYSILFELQYELGKKIYVSRFLTSWIDFNNCGDCDCCRNSTVAPLRLEC